VFIVSLLGLLFNDLDGLSLSQIEAHCQRVSKPLTRNKFFEPRWFFPFHGLINHSFIQFGFLHYFFDNTVICSFSTNAVTPSEGRKFIQGTPNQRVGIHASSSCECILRLPFLSNLGLSIISLIIQ
jgi:hypothetical protein